MGEFFKKISENLISVIVGSIITCILATFLPKTYSKAIGRAVENATQTTLYEISENKPGKYPEASLRYLIASDLEGKTNWELRVMKNEIFARHGFVFKTSEMEGYFNNQDWYLNTPKGNNNSIYSKLSEIERSNIKIIKQHE